ncbi:ComEA family DNA-binding protein [Pseudomonas sp. HK3]
MKSIQTIKCFLVSVIAAALFSLPALAESKQSTEYEGQGIQAVAAQIDINSASEEELSQLTQVGPKKAQEIIRHREANGPFKTVDDLAQVKGIGIKTVEKNRSRLLAGQ